MHKAFDNENCSIFIQENKIANKREYDSVEKYNEKYELDVQIPIFKNNRLSINKSNVAKLKWEEKI